MIRTISLVLALSFSGGVAAIELPAMFKGMSCTPSSVAAQPAVLPPPKRPKPRPMTLAANVAERSVAQRVPLSDWAEAIDLDLRHSLRF